MRDTFIKDIVYNSQGLRIALKEISDNTDYTMVLGYNMYDEKNYRSIDFKQSLKNRIKFKGGIQNENKRIKQNENKRIKQYEKTIRFFI